ncbi:MAG: transposase [Anaerolineae bacterium]|nr:transposase [Anaerolineae bacterium]
MDDEVRYIDTKRITKTGKQTFTEEFKRETAKMSYQTDKLLGTFAQYLDISHSSLSRWRKEYGQDSLPL